VLILVSTNVELTLVVELTIIVQFAIVMMVILVMHSLDAILSHVRILCAFSLMLQFQTNFIRYLAPQRDPQPDVPRDPCNPSPCGSFAQCRDSYGSPSCSCLPNYMGSPPNCRPECSINAECASNKACMNEKCRDPCPGSCGLNAQCEVINHTPICSCLDQYTGDPFTNCYPKPPPRKISQKLANFP
jgi:hypothetical protein